MSGAIHPDRRLVIAGLAGLGLPWAARADDAPASPVAHGALEKNALAQAFIAAPSTLPGVTLDTLDGEVALRDALKGRTVLMPIWAEWCVPCLIEIPDFARLQKAYGNERFAIMPVLSYPQKQMTPAATQTLFKALRAEIFPPMIEHRFGRLLVQTLARMGRGMSLPCNVLIAPDGRVVAREMGLQSNGHTVETDGGDKYARAQRAAAGETQSLWGTPVGDEFVSALAGGFLG